MNNKTISPEEYYKSTAIKSIHNFYKFTKIGKYLRFEFSDTVLYLVELRVYYKHTKISTHTFSTDSAIVPYYVQLSSMASDEKLLTLLNDSILSRLRNFNFISSNVCRLKKK